MWIRIAGVHKFLHNGDPFNLILNLILWVINSDFMFWLIFQLQISFFEFDLPGENRYFLCRPLIWIKPRHTWLQCSKNEIFIWNKNELIKFATSRVKGWHRNDIFYSLLYSYYINSWCNHYIQLNIVYINVYSNKIREEVFYFLVVKRCKLIGI